MTDRAPGLLPVLLDVDTGIDDSLALLYAAASPDLELVAVTTVAGNVPVDQVAANTLAVLELAGRPEVPVSLGAAAPLRKVLRTTEETHGPFGIGHATLPPAASVLAREPSARAIVAAARARPGELTLVTLGPMTNLALALELEPDLPRLLRGWTFMGGAFRVPGNTTPTTEWNLFVDPDAAAAALAAWERAIGADPCVPRPLGMGLDVTERARLLPGDVARLAAATGIPAVDAAELAAASPASPLLAAGPVAADPILGFVVDALRFYFEFHAANDGFYGAFIHDPFAVAATLDRGLVRVEPAFVEVETGPGPAHGMTVADWRGLTGRAPNVDVAVDGDARAFIDRLVGRLGALAAVMAPG